MSMTLEAKEDNKTAFRHGLRDGLPIGLGYFAVAFSLGFMAAKCGISPVQGFVGSFFTRASAGEYGVYSMVLQDAGYIGVAAMSIVTNLRYLLMSTALSQKFSQDTSLAKRIFTGCLVTDEIFGISIAYKGNLNPLYTVGAAAISTPLWASGTACGIIAGSALPARVVSAFSVALYGMFIAIIIPPCRTDKAVMGAVIASFLLSYAADFVSLAKLLRIDGGMVTILLTLVISALAAILCPREETEGET